MIKRQRKIQTTCQNPNCGMVFFWSTAVCPSCGSPTSDTPKAYVWWDRDEPTEAIRAATAAVGGNMTESQHIHIEGDGHSIQIARDHAKQKATAGNTITWRADLDALLVNLNALVAHVEPDQGEELEEHVILIQDAATRDDLRRLGSRLAKTRHLLGELTVGAAGNGLYEAAKLGVAAVLGHLM